MVVPLVSMIPTVQTARTHLPPLLLLALALVGCQATPPGPKVALRVGLAHYGSSSGVAATPEMPRIVIIRDRHPVHGAITRERGPLYRVRAENRGAIGFLIVKGYRLLGCEWPYGPLPRDTKPARAHRDATRTAIEGHDNLDRLSVFQPIRYEEELGDRISVLGMEDPDLYHADRERLLKIQDFRRIAGREDAPDQDREKARREMASLLRKISGNRHARGRAAARNLLKHMDRFKIARAALLIGGAHADAAREALEEQGVQAMVFQCRSYQDR